ncbi:MAG TPA: rhamnogalacturonan acetylesterase [Acidobacteriaceae bacterium]
MHSISARILLAIFALVLPATTVAEPGWSFRCTDHPARPNAAFHVLTAASTYHPDAAVPFGFDLNTAPTAFAGNACTGNAPYFFSLAVPDGNYQVTLTLGGPTPSTTTVRAESRRLFADQIKTPANARSTQVFNVNVRTPTIHTAATPTPLPVKLKPREIGALDWDEKLTLEFTGDHPSFRSITIRPILDVPTVYLAGDSTVVDQDKEPWAAWGQMLPAFFGPGISIANEAESGETIHSFISERRLDKIESTLRPGDYLLIQFAHNDQKPGTGFVSIPDYKDHLRHYITMARAHRATPILVTSMHRRTFDANGKITQTLGEYPQAARDVAAEQKVPLIDLNALSKTLFEAMGDAGTLHAFVHYPANTFPDQPKELKDDTHFNSYGAYELARAVVQSIRDQQLPLARYLRPHIPAFDPTHPDSLDAWRLPPSPSVSTTTPYGR